MCILLTLMCALNTGAFSQVVSVSFGNTLPPWVLDGGTEGLLVDIISQCLEPSGHVIKPILHPYTRRIIEYKSGNIDAVVDINPNLMQEEQLEGFLPVLSTNIKIIFIR
ncbi:MAG: hypothetical protein ACI9S6_002812 [Reinekea sp.]